MSEALHLQHPQSFPVHTPSLANLASENRFINFIAKNQEMLNLKSAHSEGLNAAAQNLLVRHRLALQNFGASSSMILPALQNSGASSSMILPDLLDSSGINMDFVRELKLAEQRAQIHSHFQVELNRITKELERERDLQLQALEYNSESNLNSLFWSALDASCRQNSQLLHIQSYLRDLSHPCLSSTCAPMVSNTKQSNEHGHDSPRTQKPSSNNPTESISGKVLDSSTFKEEIEPMKPFREIGFQGNPDRESNSKTLQPSQEARSAIIASALARLNSLEFKFHGRVKSRSSAGKKIRKMN